MRVALYARVSTGEQTTQNQLLQLRAWASSQKGMEFEEWDEAISSRKTRPVKEELLKRLRMGTLAGVAVVSLSRWGRSTVELVSEMRELHDLKRGFWSLKEGISLDTAAGRAMVGMLAVFAEFERDLAQERILAGLERRKAQGHKLGWPKGKPRHPLKTGVVMPRAEAAGL